MPCQISQPRTGWESCSGKPLEEATAHLSGGMFQEGLPSFANLPLADFFYHIFPHPPPISCIAHSLTPLPAAVTMGYGGKGGGGKLSNFTSSRRASRQKLSHPNDLLPSYADRYGDRDKGKGGGKGKFGGGKGKFGGGKGKGKGKGPPNRAPMNDDDNRKTNYSEKTALPTRREAEIVKVAYPSRKKIFLKIEEKNREKRGERERDTPTHTLSSMSLWHILFFRITTTYPRITTTFHPSRNRFL